MTYPIRASEGLTFQVADFVKKFYQKWDEVNKKMIKSDTRMTDFSPRYLFNLTDGQQLELSQNQWQQALCSAFDDKKHWKDCQFVIKTNNKTGKEIRYFVNLTETPQNENTGHNTPLPPQTTPQSTEKGQETPPQPEFDPTVPEEVRTMEDLEEDRPNVSEIPF